jgi:hypothetical protein
MASGNCSHKSGNTTCPLCCLPYFMHKTLALSLFLIVSSCATGAVARQRAKTGPTAAELKKRCLPNDATPGPKA